MFVGRGLFICWGYMGVSCQRVYMQPWLPLVFYSACVHAMQYTPHVPHLLHVDWDVEGMQELVH